jgi:hypothetical protein
MPRQDRSLDDLPLAAYGGTGMEVEPQPAPNAAGTGDGTDVAVAPAADASGAKAPAAFAERPAAPPGSDMPVPEDEPSHGPSPIDRIVHLFRTSRIAAGAGFAVVIVVGLVLLSGGGASPAATAATPTTGPTAAPTITPPSGDASLALSGGVSGTFPLMGAAGGQHVDGSTVTLAWADAQQTTLGIAGPRDRGTRTTDAQFVLTLGVLVNGQPVTFTSMAGECTIGMAPVGTKLQGSITCHRLKSADGKLSLEVSGTYRT